MKKKYLLPVLIVSPFVLCIVSICCIAGAIIVGGTIERRSQENFFDDNRQKFVDLASKYSHENDLDYVKKTTIDSKEFTVYIDPTNDAIVFETDKPFDLNRLDYVYIEDDRDIDTVEECNPYRGKGKYIKKLEDHWHLCYGEWM